MAHVIKTYILFTFLALLMAFKECGTGIENISKSAAIQFSNIKYRNPGKHYRYGGLFKVP